MVLIKVLYDIVPFHKKIIGYSKLAYRWTVVWSLQSRKEA